MFFALFEFSAPVCILIITIELIVSSTRVVFDDVTSTPHCCAATHKEKATELKTSCSEVNRNVLDRPPALALCVIGETLRAKYYGITRQVCGNFEGNEYNGVIFVPVGIAI